jgi:hypothetical protein
LEGRNRRLFRYPSTRHRFGIGLEQTGSRTFKIARYNKLIAMNRTETYATVVEKPPNVRPSPEKSSYRNVALRPRGAASHEFRCCTLRPACTAPDEGKKNHSVPVGKNLGAKWVQNPGFESCIQWARGKRTTGSAKLSSIHRLADLNLEPEGQPPMLSEKWPHLGHKTRSLSCIWRGRREARAIESAGLMGYTANSIPTAPTNVLLDHPASCPGRREAPRNASPL